MSCDGHFRAWALHPLTATASEFQELEDRLQQMLFRLFAAGGPGATWADEADFAGWSSHPANRRRVYEVPFTSPITGETHVVKVYPGWRWQNEPDFSPLHLSTLAAAVADLCRNAGVTPD